MERILCRLSTLFSGAKRKGGDLDFRSQLKNSVEGLSWIEEEISDGVRIMRKRRGNETFNVLIEYNGSASGIIPLNSVKVGRGEEEIIDALSAFDKGEMDRGYLGVFAKIEETNEQELFRGMSRTMVDLAHVDKLSSIVSETRGSRTLHMSSVLDYAETYAERSWSDVVVTYDVSILNETGHFIPDWIDNSIENVKELEAFPLTWWVTNDATDETEEIEEEIATDSYWVNSLGLMSVQWVPNDQYAHKAYASSVKNITYRMYDGPRYWGKTEDSKMSDFIKKFRLPPLPDFSAINEARERNGVAAKIRDARYNLITSWYEQFNITDPIEDFSP